MMDNIVDYISYVTEKCEGGDFAAGWLQRGSTDRRGMFVARVYMDMCKGSARDALVFSQVMYWADINPETLKPRMTYVRDGNDGVQHLWIVKMGQEWADEVGLLSTVVARSALKNLAGLNLIVKEAHKSPFHSGVTVCHVRPNWPEIGRLISELQVEKPPIEDDQDDDSDDTPPEADDKNSKSRTTKTASLERPKSLSGNDKNSKSRMTKSTSPIPTESSSELLSESLSESSSSSSPTHRPEEEEESAIDDLAIVEEMFGGMTQQAKKCIEKDREKTIGWSHYVKQFNRCLSEGEKPIGVPSRWIWECLQNGDPVKPLPVETDEQRRKREFAEMTVAQRMEKLAAEAIEQEKADEEWEARQAEREKAAAKKKEDAAARQRSQEITRQWQGYAKAVRDNQKRIAEIKRRRQAELEYKAAQKRRQAKEQEDWEKVNEMIAARRKEAGLEPIVFANR